jgi:hypothetical protein
MRDTGCKERHSLDVCPEFTKLFVEARVAKLMGLNLCLFCMRHTDDKDCYAKTKDWYKGCEEGGCGQHHHKSIHYGIKTACLFSVKVGPASWPEGTQQFDLHQRVLMGKEEICISYDGGANMASVTREYALRRRLKKVSSNIPVVEFRKPRGRARQPLQGPLESQRQEEDNGDRRRRGLHQHRAGGHLPPRHHLEVPAVLGEACI